MIGIESSKGGATGSGDFSRNFLGDFLELDESNRNGLLAPIMNDLV